MSEHAAHITDARQHVATRIVAATSSWAKGASLEGIRAGFEDLLAGPDGTEILPATLADLPAMLCVPESACARGIVLFCHGGGFQIGSVQSHRSLMSRMAAAAGVRTMGFDYRLAPEHRFPAAAEDCFAAYRALLAEGYRPEEIIVAGDSAGGNLALGIALQVHEHGIGGPAAIVLLSPWLDLTLRGDSYTSRASRDIFSKADQLRAMAKTYLGRGGDPHHPLATPLDADLAGLPPILIHAGDADITLDDAVLLHQRAAQAGVICQLKVWPDMYHHFQVFAQLPEAQQSLDEIGQFIRLRLADNG